MKIRIGLAAILVSASAWSALAAESKSYWGHQYAKDCQAERQRMMDEAHQYAFNHCRRQGTTYDKKKTDFIFIVDKGQKLGKSFKQHFCEVKGMIYCN